jgi:hypothetical protein
MSPLFPPLGYKSTLPSRQLLVSAPTFACYRARALSGVSGQGSWSRPDAANGSKSLDCFPFGGLRASGISPPT